MKKRRRIFTASSIAIILIAIGAVTAVAATRGINVQNPETPIATTRAGTIPAAAYVPPVFVPLGTRSSAPQQVGSTIAAPDNRPVAQFATPPPGLQTVTAEFPAPSAPASASQISYSIIASVRATINGHAVLVTTTRPSAAAAQQATSLGNRTVKLANGTTAWATDGTPGGLPNRVVWVEDDFIITVASDLPTGEIENLATKVIVK